ncbi:unnamed protein product [Brassica napus]|uniref:(rape) hypothetical protein n=1 Tax=Brassica napus TaxID=3708 RepID=A0A816QRD1_BRANA|nr:unnamed protein product [Brassica napus]
MMLLTTISFFLSSLLPLLLPSHGSRLSLQILPSAYVSDQRAAALHHHSMLKYIHRRSYTVTI